MSRTFDGAFLLVVMMNVKAFIKVLRILELWFALMENFSFFVAGNYRCINFMNRLARKTWSLRRKMLTFR